MKGYSWLSTLDTFQHILFCAAASHSLETSSCKTYVLKADVFHPPVLLKKGVNGIVGVSGQIRMLYTWTQMKRARRNFLWDGVN